MEYDDLLVYIGECGAELEMWEYIGSTITSFCDNCERYHIFKLEGPK